MKNLPLPQFGDRLIDLLPKVMQEISRYENNYISTGKITCQQSLVLGYINQNNPSRMHDLAEAMQTSFSTMTGMVDRLVNHGLAQRVRGTEDRRTVMVSITTKGENILKEINEQKKEGIIKLFERLTPQERSQYLDILETLVERLSEPIHH